MKKNQFKLFAVAAIMSTTLAVQSCGSDDDPIPTPSPTGIAQNPDDFKGEVKSGETVTLDATKTYKITGAVVVKDGGKLVIPAGTKFDAVGATSAYVTVEQGGQIFANGTASNPIVFTSSLATPGSWGGIVICGRAPINKGTSATSEVGNGQYGGTNASDNSGSLSYVRIEYAGAIFNTNKEFNGLSLFGVGNGTTINNISVINGSDDGIEFFGGTVNATNIVSVSNEDDAFDWTEGWNGTVNYVYSKRRADGTGNRGFEGDNNSNNNAATPMSSPTINNITLIGGTTGEADAMKLREGTNAKIDNVVLSNWATGINIEHDISVTNLNGTGKITNVKFESVGTQASAKLTGGATATILTNTFSENASATGAGNGTATPTWAAGWAGI